MKILLHEDFSGVHFNLKKGLEKLGHTVILASTGDGWKKIPSDFNISSNSNLKIIKYIHTSKLILKLINNDIIQITNPLWFSFFRNRLINEKVINFILTNNNKSFLLECGCTPNFYNYYEKLFGKSPCKECQRFDLNEGICFHNSLDAKNKNKFLEDRVNGIIPMNFDYHSLYKDFKNVTEIIPFPIDTDQTLYSPNVLNGKLRIFHGINRRGFKGTNIIEPALYELEKKHPESVEVIMRERIPFIEYSKFLSRVNIVVDQVFGYGVGMNALMSMANGRVVFSGFEMSSNSEITSIPVERFNGDKNLLIAKLERYIRNPNLLEEMSLKSRLYIENTHNYKTVASKFISIWGKY